MTENHPSPAWRSRRARRLPLAAGIAILGLTVASACSSSSSKPAKSAGEAAADMATSCGGTQADWNTLISAAEKEGKLSIAGPPNPTVNKDVPAAFKKEFGISVTYLAGQSGETAQKIKSERSAGIYSLDDFLAGGNTMSTVIYGSHWLDDLKSALVSPKLTQAATWQGKATGAPFVDQPSYNSVAKLSIQGQEQFMVNTDLVKDGQINGWKDLLDPKWKGKIVAMDPTTGSGLGFNVAVMLQNKFGTDFINQLYKGQKVVLQSDDRQAADAVAKGQYAVAIGVSEANGQLDQLIADGLPIRVVSRPDDAPQMVSAGYGEIGLMNKAPHPAAAKLFANWVLCPDGNKAWNEANRYQSTRADVSVDVPDFIKADLNSTFWDTYDWKLLTSNTTDQFVDQLSRDLK
ncbi:MAG TPA: extracellular solute-binding protein [Jatrophihabitantaceae bacterium]